MSRMLSKMNLWVRSKRKNYLMNISNLKIEEYNGYYCIETKIDGNIFELGQYSSRERAIEVLDEIQKLLKTAELNDDINIIVYQMPKD